MLWCGRPMDLRLQKTMVKREVVARAAAGAKNYNIASCVKSHGSICIKNTYKQGVNDRGSRCQKLQIDRYFEGYFFSGRIALKL